MITVVGAGGGAKDELSLKAYNTILSANKVFLRTSRMPIAELLDEQGVSYSSFDDLYEQCPDFDQLNKQISEILSAENDCVYVVFGSALDDTSVNQLSNCKIIPGISLESKIASSINFCENYFSATASDVIAGKYIDVHQNNVITCIDSQIIASELKCLLADKYDDEFEIVYAYQDCSGNVTSSKICVFELDRQDHFDHTTTVIIKKSNFLENRRHDMTDLMELTSILCADDGCPWDSKQTHESLRRYLIEEAYEVADTIETGDLDSLSDELGDILFQVTMHCALAEKHSEFVLHDVTENICKKMIRRHPHLFGDGKFVEWEDLKKSEKDFATCTAMLNDIPKTLPTLLYAEKAQARAEKCGIKSEVKHDELNEEQLGNILFETIKVCRENNVSPELALRNATNRFIKECKNAKN